MFDKAILRAVIALSLALPVVACGSDEAAQDASSDKTPAPLATVPIGKSTVVDGFECGLIAAKQKKQLGTPGLGPNSGGEDVYLSAQYTLKNLSEAPVDGVNFPKFELIDARGQVYAEDKEASTVEGMLNDAHTGALNPGVTAKLVSVWKINKSAFDPKTWKIKVSFDRSLGAGITVVARWPLETTFPDPVLLDIK